MPKGKTDPEAVALATAPDVEGFAAYCLLAHETDSPWIYGGRAGFAEPQWAIAETLCEGMGTKKEPAKDWANRLRIIYVSATASQAYKISNAVKNTIEFNGIYQALFPKVKKDANKWSEPEWKVKGNTVKDSTFLALGEHGPVLGSRGDVIVLDDIANLQVRESPAEREHLEDWLNTELVKVMVPHPEVRNVVTLAPRGSAKTTITQWWVEWVIGMASLGYPIPRGHRMLCTRWYEGDPADWAQERGWNILKLRAIQEDEEGNEQSFWPERFTLEELQKERKLSPLSFALQMQNEIVPDEGDLFRRDHFRNRFQEPPRPDEILRVFATWDSAATITGRSFTAGCVVVLTKGWRYYVIHLVRAKLEYPDLRAAVRDIATRFRVDMTLIEEKSSGIQLVQELARDSSMHGSVVGLKPAGQRGGPPARPTKGKEPVAAEIEWVQTVTAPYADGKVWLPSGQWFRQTNTEDWTDTFITEHLRYPGEPNDVVIAMSQLVYLSEIMRHEWDDRERRKALGPMRWGNPNERRGGRPPPVPARRRMLA